MNDILLSVLVFGLGAMFCAYLLDEFPFADWFKQDNSIPIYEVKGFEYLKDLDPATVDEWICIKGEMKCPDGSVKTFCGQVPKPKHWEEDSSVKQDFDFIYNHKTPETNAWVYNLQRKMDKMSDDEIIIETKRFANYLRSMESNKGHVDA